MVETNAMVRPCCLRIVARAICHYWKSDVVDGSVRERLFTFSRDSTKSNEWKPNLTFTVKYNIEVVKKKNNTFYYPTKRELDRASRIYSRDCAGRTLLLIGSFRKNKLYRVNDYVLAHIRQHFVKFERYKSHKKIYTTVSKKKSLSALRTYDYNDHNMLGTVSTIHEITTKYLRVK